ncbi:MAG TPA: polysaccharide lyase family 7 protein [Candidatus Sulfotelmatobacter sp.]|nr:polysaccharide lyase family 7 protein [Candidatus Sulfotelmatobacter sp.]
MKPESLLMRLALIIPIGWGAFVAGPAQGAETNALADPTGGWKQVAFKYEIQHPYDLPAPDRYDFDATNNIHHFWIYYTDKPHSPPPNRTNARSEMRLETYNEGERMFDGDLNISAGTYACIGQVFDAAHGPVAMLIAHPDGTVTVSLHDSPGVHDMILTNAIGRWWNLKMQNDTRDGGKINIYVDNVLAGTYASRGPREYYFKCGVYAREGSGRSEVLYRNIKMWARIQASTGS